MAQLIISSVHIVQKLPLLAKATVIEGQVSYSLPFTLQISFGRSVFSNTSRLNVSLGLGFRVPELDVDFDDQKSVFIEESEMCACTNLQLILPLVPQVSKETPLPSTAKLIITLREKGDVIFQPLEASFTIP